MKTTIAATIAHASRFIDELPSFKSWLKSELSRLVAFSILAARICTFAFIAKFSV